MTRAMTCRTRRIVLPAIVAAVAPLSSAIAGVTFDGSVGQAGALAGPQYTIPASRGALRGSNLFHSFSEFNLTKGEAAVFSGPSSVQNVLARVTGGSASSIDGKIQSTIPDANFYLINPAGVVFGSNASLDVGGSFYVTTAKVVHLDDGGKFTASVNPSESVLTSAAPASFGFAGTPAGVTIGRLGEAQTQLKVKDGQSLSVVSGPVQIVNGKLVAPGGTVRLRATASANDPIPVDPNQDVQFNNAADVTLSSNSAVDVAADFGGGFIQITARNVELGQSLLDVSGAPFGGTVQIDATGTLALRASQILAGSSDGFAGQVNLNAASLSLTENARLELGGKESGGTATIIAPNISLNDATIAADASTGSGGVIAITSDALAASGATEISARGDSGAGSIALQSTADPGIPPSVTVNGAPGFATLDANVGLLQFHSFSIVRDGSLGPDGGVMPVAGSDPAMFEIPAEDGQLHGRNLFHSFSLFNLGSNEIALFKARIDGAPVEHVLARVTGGRSTIDGSVQLDDALAGADLFLMNPAGIVFGKNGNLNVGGSATFTTASAINLNDGGTFAAALAPGVDHLTAGAPAAFHFDGPTVASIEFKGEPTARGALTVPEGAALTLIGGDVKFENWLIGSGTGSPARLNIVSLAGQAEVAFSASGSTADPVVTPAGGPFGAVSLTDSRIQAIGSPAAPPVYIKAGELRLTTTGSAGGSEPQRRSAISAAMTTQRPVGEPASPAIRLDVQGEIDVDQSIIASPGGLADGTGSKRGGDISVNAASVRLAGRGAATDANYGLSTDAQGSGRGGDIAITTDSLSTVEKGGVFAFTHDSNPGGSVVIHAGSISLDDGLSGNLGRVGGIQAQTFGAADGGKGGKITIDTSTLTVKNGASIDSSTFGSGDGGDIEVTSHGPVEFNGGSINAPDTGIVAVSRPFLPNQVDADTPAIHGSGGNIKVVVDNGGGLTLLNGGIINATTNTAGKGGSISVQADQIQIRGQVANVETGIVAGSNRTQNDSPDRSGLALGDAGTINISGHELRLMSGGVVRASTSDAGKGGDVKIGPFENVVVDGEGAGFFTAITVGTSKNVGTGNQGGTIQIDAASLLVQGEGRVTSQSSGSGNAGSIQINGNELRVLNGGSISAAAMGGGNGGSVNIRESSTAVDQNGAISSATAMSGAGGSIGIDADSLLVQGGGRITSQSNGSGHAGMIRIAGNELRVQSGGSISAASFSSGAGGDVNVSENLSVIDKGGLISSAADATGDAGGVNLSGNQPGSRIIIRPGGQVTTRANQMNGGDIAISARSTSGVDSKAANSQASDVQVMGGVVKVAPGSIDIEGSRDSAPDQPSVSAMANGNGGAVTLDAPTRIELRNATVTSESTTGDGGRLMVGPVSTVAPNVAAVRARPAAGGAEAEADASSRPDVFLDRADLVAKAGRQGGDIQITAQTFLRTADSRLDASSKVGMPGTITVDAPDTDVVAGLARLAGELVQAGARLQETCAHLVSDRVSRFARYGGGATPAEPGALLPGVDISPPSDDQ